jgi:hypothetical protein
MFSRPLLFVAILVAAAGIPYVLNNPQLKNKLAEQWQLISKGQSAANADYPATTFTTTPTASTSGGMLSWLTSSAEPQPLLPPPPPVFDFAEVLRLDVPPEFVVQRWPRVTTVLAESDLQGLRVPLVTGPNVDDLTGSLTYYFDKQRICQRVTFQGTSGDPRRLVMLCTMLHEMQGVPSLNAGLYVRVKSNQPESLLQVDYAPVVKLTSPHQAAALTLELNRPKSQYGMSTEAKQRLVFHQQTNRW